MASLQRLFNQPVLVLKARYSVLFIFQDGECFVIVLLSFHFLNKLLFLSFFKSGGPGAGAIFCFICYVAVCLIGASLSEPHTSVYSGIILLCVRMSVRPPYRIISDNSSHVELTCVFKFTCTST